LLKKQFFSSGQKNFFERFFQKLHLAGVAESVGHLYVGIYDGHCGHMVSVALRQNFYGKLSEGGCFVPNLPEEDLRARIRKVFLDTDEVRSSQAGVFWF
jgi:hypothetical protein